MCLWCCCCKWRRRHALDNDEVKVRKNFLNMLSGKPNQKPSPKNPASLKLTSKKQASNIQAGSWPPPLSAKPTLNAKKPPPGAAKNQQKPNKPGGVTGKIIDPMSALPMDEDDDSSLDNDIDYYRMPRDGKQQSGSSSSSPSTGHGKPLNIGNNDEKKKNGILSAYDKETSDNENDSLDVSNLSGKNIKIAELDGDNTSPLISSPLASPKQNSDQSQQIPSEKSEKSKSSENLTKSQQIPSEKIDVSKISSIIKSDASNQMPSSEQHEISKQSQSESQQMPSSEKSEESNKTISSPQIKTAQSSTESSESPKYKTQSKSKASEMTNKTNLTPLSKSLSAKTVSKTVPPYYVKSGDTMSKPKIQPMARSLSKPPPIPLMNNKAEYNNKVSNTKLGHGIQRRYKENTLTTASRSGESSISHRSEGQYCITRCIAMPTQQSLYGSCPIDYGNCQTCVRTCCEVYPNPCLGSSTFYICQ